MAKNRHQWAQWPKELEGLDALAYQIDGPRGVLQTDVSQKFFEGAQA